MSLIELVSVAAALGFDAFSVSLGVGACWSDFRSRFRLSWHFGLFQFIMPLIGWQVGAQILPYIRAWDHWFVFAVLIAIAAKMLYESWKSATKEPDETCNPTRGWMLIGLSIATSIDALGVGLTFGSLESQQILYAAVVGVVAALMTATGMVLAAYVSRRIGTWAERCGALILAIVAFKLLLTV
jgi:putative Mn2+ efflux pump MntP